MRLIDADKLILELATSRNYHAINCREENLLSRDIIVVNEQPTIKAVEVIRHAHWVNNVDEYWNAVKYATVHYCNGIKELKEYCGVSVPLSVQRSAAIFF